MKGFTELNYLELFREATYRVNKRSSAGLSTKSVVVLIVVFRAEKMGLTITQEQVLARLFKTHNMGTKMGDVELIRRLVDRGYLSKTREGRRLMIATTVAGSNYVLMLSRTLKELRNKF